MKMRRLVACFTHPSRKLPFSEVNSTLTPVSVAKDSRLGRPQVQGIKIRAGPSSEYPVS